MSIKKLFDLPKTSKMPVLFFGHGSPMNTIETNTYTTAWKKVGSNLPKPQAILVISAHWETAGSLIQSSPHPKQVYDFYGFPKELYNFKYQPVGFPDMSREVQSLVTNSSLSEDWGLDHGAWSVLAHLFPKADIPTFQLSIDKKLSPEQHLELSRQLSKLRDHGVLIVGSGNIVHNLRVINWTPNSKPYDWSIELDQKIKDLVLKKDFAGVSKLIFTDSSLMKTAHPTLEHFIPLLYSLGASGENSESKVIVDGIDLGSISMTSFLLE